jgi:hypothetical protein
MSHPAPEFRNGRRYQIGNYSCCDSFGEQITLPSGKIALTGQQSFYRRIAEKRGYPVKLVTVQGACLHFNAIDRAFDNFPVWIDGQYAPDMKDRLATDDEFHQLMNAKQ